jgi:hypothetical protein
VRNERPRRSSFLAGRVIALDRGVVEAVAIERSLGLPDGAFANRPRDWLRIDLVRRLRWNIDHRTAVATIYYAPLALWVFAALAAVGELARRHDKQSWWSIQVISLFVAAALTAAGPRAVKAQKKRIAEQMR